MTQSDDPYIDSWETSNLYLLARAIASSALIRTESRGSHWREDFPHQEDRWKVRIEERLTSGVLVSNEAPLSIEDGSERRW